MSWFSILPAHWTFVETWIVRFFLLLAIFTIAPWAFFVVYDLLLYIVRAAFYEIPYIGGRARGKRRPRAPSLAETSTGRPRGISIRRPVISGSEAGETDGLRGRSANHDDRGAVPAEN